MLRHQKDSYQLQRLALSPSQNGFSIDRFSSTLTSLSFDNQTQLLELILNQGVQFFWLEVLRLIPHHSFSERVFSAVKTSCIKSTTRYLAQRKILMEIDILLGEVGIEYVVFKGAHVREAVYDNPIYRPSIDIDLLVSPAKKNDVLQTLCSHGFQMHPDPANISHEVSVRKDGVSVDLHWDIMRPGRMRIGLVEHFLRNRQRNDYFWGLDNETALFVMLVHPVFTKYSTAPQSAIVRLVDICKWLEVKEINWEKLQKLLNRAGMQTAAWITGTVLSILTSQQLPQQFLREVTPKNPKKTLLRFWLNQNLSAKFVDYPLLPKYLFTLLAHDKIADVLRFSIKLFKENKSRQTAMDELEKAIDR